MKYLAKTIEYGLYLLVFLLPWQTRWIIKAGELEYTTYSLYGTDILLIILLLFFLFYKFPISNFQFLKKSQIPNPNDQKNPKSQIPNYFIIGLLAISFISIFFAIDKPLAIYKFGWLVLGFGLFLVVSRAAYDRSKLVWSLLAGLGLEAGLAVWQFLTQQTFASKWLGLAWHQASDLGASVIESAGADGVGERWLRAYAGFDHPNVLGGVMAIGILLLAGEMIKNIQYPISNIQINSKFNPASSAGQNSKLISWLFLILFSAALFFSFSRAAWLGLGAGLAAMLAGAAMKKNLIAQKNILEAVLMSGLIFFILFFQFPSLALTRLYGGARLEAKSKNERLDSIKYALPIIKKNWLSGAGPGNYVLALKRELNGREIYFYEPAHNVFILVWSETGMLGLLFFLLLIVFAFVRLLRRLEYKAPRNDSVMGIFVALLVLLSLDHWLWSLHFGALFFWLAMGLMV